MSRLPSELAVSSRSEGQNAFCPLEKPFSLLLVGSGSMACLFAARLAAAGTSVTLLGSWPEGLAALRRDGVRLLEPDGRERAYPLAVLPCVQAAQPASFTHAIVLVKSWQTQRATEHLAAVLRPDGLALTLQNGLGNVEILASILGSGRVLQGVTTLGANLLAPGLVQATGEGPVTLGESPRSDEFAAPLQAAGFEVQTKPDLAALVWGKLVINAAINPLTALLGIANGELLTHHTARKLMPAAVCEAAVVAAALGIRLPYDNPLATVEAVARRTAINRSSMLQDVARGAPTEIDAINGAVVRAGEGAGVLTPVNLSLWQLVKGL
ncbi:MAG: ketopantoate reductase family protein [Chloroflexota bacterium]